MEHDAQPQPTGDPGPPPRLTPPPVLPPPPVQQPRMESAPARRGGRGWMVLSLFLLMILGFIGLRWVAGLFGGGGASTAMHVPGAALQEVVVEDNGSEDNFLVIDVSGIIASSPMDASGVSMVDSISAQLDRAAEDDSIHGVLLKIDSPGGEVLASDDIYRAIVRFQEESKKPVLASMGSLAASGGYYIAAACRWIVANELSITGSIGVIMHTYNYRGLMDKVGVRPEVFKSGRFKDMLSGEKNEVSPEERAMLDAMIAETYQRFKSVVQEGRNQAYRSNKGDGKLLRKDWAEHADGRIFSGKQALEVGFVDEVGTTKDSVNRLLKLTGLTRANLVKYQEPFDFMNVLRFLGKSDVSSVKVNLGVELPRIQAGRLYYLAPSFMR